jgi:hypothetical protein
MLVHYDAYNCICSGGDPDDGIGDTVNIVRCLGMNCEVGGFDFPLIQVSDEEYQEFLAVKRRLNELQDIFTDRILTEETK